MGAKHCKRAFELRGEASFREQISAANNDPQEGGVIARPDAGSVATEALPAVSVVWRGNGLPLDALNVGNKGDLR